MSMTTWTTRVYGIDAETINKIEIDKCIDLAMEVNTDLRKNLDKIKEAGEKFYIRRDEMIEIIEDYYGTMYSVNESDNIYACICEDIEQQLGLNKLDITYMYIEHNEEGDIVLGFLPVYPWLESKDNLEAISKLTQKDIDTAFVTVFRKLGISANANDVGIQEIENWG